jgi:hypothetical protein
MAEFKVSVSLPSVMNARPELAGQMFPLLSQAVNAVAQQTAINWQEAVYRAKLWSGEKDAYAKTIQMKMTGPYSALVWSDYKYASDIEEGRPPRDLKRMLDTSMKVRTTKDGRRFLVIPFRHNTPGNDALAPAMPTSVYELAKQMAPSSVAGQRVAPAGERTALSPFGMRPLKKQVPFASNPVTKQTYMVPRNTYKWGDKLPAMALASPAEGRKYANMYRFDATTPGARSYSTYLTFRVMMEGSSGWIVPAQPGQHIAQKVAEEMQPIAEEAFGEALKRSAEL